jgi:UDP-2,4-diacetamido-2,4,6-trideoxy-beta-L-altropyranose hydrolase
MALTSRSMAGGHAGRQVEFVRIVVRTDASSQIGSGHVIRCLGLSDRLAASGHEIAFVCALHPGHLADVVRSRGFVCYTIEPLLSQQDDAIATLAKLVIRPDLFIVDHYNLDYVMETILRKQAQVMVIDDLADRPHDCDLLLDATHEADAVDIYDALVPKSARRLVGLDYLMLRPEFAPHRGKPRSFARVERLLVTFGGNDPADLSNRALDALDLLGSDLHVDLLTGRSNPRHKQLVTRAREDERIDLHVQHPRPSDLMAKADLFLGAAGMTIWESCYLGLPSLFVKMAENQSNSAAILYRHRAAKLIGFHETITAGEIASELNHAIHDRDWRQITSANAMNLVQGKGLDLVSAAIERFAAERRLER